MARRSLQVDDALYRYLIDQSVREHPEQRALREATASHPHAVMQISPEQGQFMALLVKLLGTHRAIEVGVFTGYSALTVALALPDDGRLLACDVSDEYTRVGRPFWERAGVADKIELRLAPARETLDTRLAAGEAGQYDFAFIDADKTGYDAYTSAACSCCARRPDRDRQHALSGRSRTRRAPIPSRCSAQRQAARRRDASTCRCCRSATG
jgi:caffeoyl-CoA O-methyltransferase